jgi:hypothetical protein
MAHGSRARRLRDSATPRSGSRDRREGAGVLDVFMETRENMKTWMRTGPRGSTRKQEAIRKTFVDCDDTQRKAILDDIAWPRRARQEMQAGVRFFTNFRNFTTSGFWSSNMGIDDLQYMGNRPMSTWKDVRNQPWTNSGVRYSC